MDNLKEFLTEVKKDEYKIKESYNLDEIIEAMLKEIGSPDYVLRDKLIYTTFSNWFSDGTFNKIRRKHILNTALGEEYLFYNIHLTDEFSVFKRSFSSLVIALALYSHNKDEYLTLDEVLNVKEIVLKYIKYEKDYRGYVIDYGWAHSIAHIADVLSNLANTPTLNKENILEILNSISYLLENDKVCYSFGEQGRLAYTFLKILDKNLLSDNEIVEWFEENFVIKDIKSLKSPYSDYIWGNKKIFLHEAYFDLEKDSIKNEIYSLVRSKTYVWGAEDYVPKIQKGN